jgi:hypothetical protein
MHRYHIEFIWFTFVFVTFIGLCLGCGTENGRSDLSTEIKNLVGTEYIYPKSTEIINKYGFPKTLSGTNNSRWVAYFPKGDFTIISDKNTNTIKRVLPGKRPQ